MPSIRIDNRVIEFWPEGSAHIIDFGRALDAEIYIRGFITWEEMLTRDTALRAGKDLT